MNPNPSSPSDLKPVFSFWNTEACGTHFVGETPGTREFYEKYRAFRYQTEWHIPELVPFSEAKGKSVLEIGCGNGADGVMFALNGALYTGVDLTQAAIDATSNHFSVLGLTGTFQRANAEALEFADDSFDWVYSHGVLHHTARPQRAIDEVHRVLKPGGQAIIMLYHQGSFNFHVRIMGYMRLRVLATIMMRFFRHSTDRKTAQDRALQGVRGNEESSVYEIHYENFLRKGWSYLKPENFIHHCTDGPECPYAYAYSRAGAKVLFSKFQNIRMQAAHFPLRKYRFLSRIPHFLERFLASHMGWYLFIYAKK